MFVNTVLVPMSGGKLNVEGLQQLWVDLVQPIARTPYDEVVAKGYGCNVFLSFNVGFGASGTSKVRSLPIEGVEDDPPAKFDLTFVWVDGDEGEWVIHIESGVGDSWHRLEERLTHVLHQIT